jgi:catechol 1,2-dioxygenase
VTQALVGQYVLHAAEEAAPSGDVSGAWYSLAHHFVLEPGEATLPRPPITGKAGGTRPPLEILERRP